MLTVNWLSEHVLNTPLCTDTFYFLAKIEGVCPWKNFFFLRIGNKSLVLWGEKASKVMTQYF